MAMRSQPQGRVRFQSGLVPLFALVGNSRDVVTGAVPAAINTAPVSGYSPSGRALQFTGAGGLNYGNNVARDLFYNRGPSSLLIEFYLPPGTRSNSVALIGKNDGGNVTGWNLYVNANNTVTFSLTGATNYYVLTTSTIPASKLVPGQRNTILIVYTGDLTSSNLASAYINGTFVGSNGGGAPTGNVGDSNYPLMIGGADPSWGNSAFTGSISLIAAFRGQLAPAGKSGSTPEGGVQALAIHNNPWRAFSSGDNGEAPPFTAAVVAPAALSGAAAAVASAFGSLSTGIKLSGTAVASATATGSLTTGAAGSLNMSVVSAGTSNFDLTALGGTDWIVYPNSTPVRKNGGGSQIAVAHVGSFSDSVATDSKETSTWSDGAGTVSGTTNSLIFSSTGDGVGYSVTLPADTTLRAATVILGVYNTRMRITATLSDGSATQLVDTSIVSDSSGGNPAAITLTYRAASAGQTLTITGVQIAPSGYANTSFQGAALRLVATAAALGGTAAAVATGSGALSTAVPLSGAAPATASAAGALTTAVRLAGNASATTTAAGSLTTSLKLAGAAAGVATGAGALTTAIQLAGAAANMATAGGALSTSIPLSGSAQAVALATGVLAGSSAALAGSAIASATATGALATRIVLSGGAQAVAQAYGALAGGGAALSGVAQASASAGGVLVTSIPLVGGSAAQASASGALATSIPLAGTANAVASASGSFGGGSASLSGSAQARASASGALATSICLNGVAAAWATASGALTTAIAVSGAASASAACAGMLATRIALVGSARAVSSAAGDLSVGVKYARAPAGSGYSPQSRYNETRPAATSLPRPAATQRNYR